MPHAPGERTRVRSGVPPRSQGDKVHGGTPDRARPSGRWDAGMGRPFACRSGYADLTDPQVGKRQRTLARNSPETHINGQAADLSRRIIRRCSEHGSPRQAALGTGHAAERPPIRPGRRPVARRRELADQSRRHVPGSCSDVIGSWARRVTNHAKARPVHLPGCRSACAGVTQAGRVSRFGIVSRGVARDAGSRSGTAGHPAR
jgi:hypothetical protein